MIGRLQGIIIEKSPPEVVLDVNGVGYELQLPMTCFYELPAVGESATIITHFVVREDAQLLYGFNTNQERQLFRVITSDSIHYTKLYDLSSWICRG